jgi:hypothetical protein
MNYVKTFDIEASKIEEQVNPYLQELAEKKHRVMHTNFYFYEVAFSSIPNLEMVRVVIVVNDSPHPHAKGNETKE